MSEKKSIISVYKDLDDVHNTSLTFMNSFLKIVEYYGNDEKKLKIFYEFIIKYLYATIGLIELALYGDGDSDMDENDKDSK